MPPLIKVRICKDSKQYYEKPLNCELVNMCTGYALRLKNSEDLQHELVGVLADFLTATQNAWQWCVYILNYRSETRI